MNQIAEDEVQVWFARLDRSGDDDLARARAILSADEIERAESYKFEHHRRRFVVARATLRELLSELLQRRAESIRFEYNAAGKPALCAESGSKLRFNLSHSKDLAMYAFAMNREVGVDVEAIDEKTASGKIAENFFSPREVAALRALPRENQAEGFFNCWTRKEACVKARGVGLAHVLKDFEVSLRPDEKPEIVDGSGWANWSLFSFRPSAGYVAALAVEGREVRVVGPLTV